VKKYQQTAVCAKMLIQNPSSRGLEDEKISANCYLRRPLKKCQKLCEEKEKSIKIRNISTLIPNYSESLMNKQ